MSSRCNVLIVEDEGLVAKDLLRMLSNVVEETADLVCITDEEGVIEYANPAFIQLTGYTREELLKNTPRLLKSGQYGPDFYEWLWATILAGNVFRARMTNRKKNGELYYEEKTITPIKNAAGAITHFVSIGKDVTEQRRLEQEILNATEREQQRIGREVHDGLGQLLTGIGCLMACLEKKLREKELSECKEATGLVDLVSQAIKETRSIACGLSKDSIRRDGLITALQGLASQVRDAHGISCVVTGVGELSPDCPEAALHLYRITQEAVNNALKHGKATEIAIRLALREGASILTVRDNGSGLGHTSQVSRGIGLRTMAYRAHILGGILSVVPDAAGGVLVTCSYPSTHSAYHAYETQDITC